MTKACLIGSVRSTLSKGLGVVVVRWYHLAGWLRQHCLTAFCGTSRRVYDTSAQRSASAERASAVSAHLPAWGPPHCHEHSHYVLL